MGMTCFEPFEVRLASYEPKTYLFSRLCPFTSSHARIHRSTSPPPYIYTSVSHLHIQTVTPSRPSFLSLFLYIFSTALDNHMSRSRATRRLVVHPILFCHAPSFSRSPSPTSLCFKVSSPCKHALRQSNSTPERSRAVRRLVSWMKQMQHFILELTFCEVLLRAQERFLVLQHSLHMRILLNAVFVHGCFGYGSEGEAFAALWEKLGTKGRSGCFHIFPRVVTFTTIFLVLGTPRYGFGLGGTTN